MQAVGHAVRDAQALDGERSDLHAFTRRDRLQAIAQIDPVLFETMLDEGQGEP